MEAATDITLAPNQPSPGTMDQSAVLEGSSSGGGVVVDRKPQSEPIPYQGVNADMDLKPQPELAPGLKEEQKARMAGFSEEEIAQGRQEEIQKMKSAGFSDPEIQDVYGLKEPDMKPFKDTFTANLDAAKAAEKEKAANSTATAGTKEVTKPHPAESLAEAWSAGWQGSVAGIFTGQKLPDTVLPEDADWAMQIAATIPSLAGDMPTFLAGLSFGTAVGGGPVVGVATGMAVTEAYRDILLEHYTKGDITSAREFAVRAAGAAWAASKGFVTGAATEYVGGKIGAKFLAKTGSEVFSNLARFTAEVPTMVGLAKGLEGELPNRTDFLVSGLTIGGFHGIRTVAPKMMQIYKETGMRPAEIMEAADSDIQLRQEIVAEDSNITPYQMQGLAPPDFGSVKNVIGDAANVLLKPLKGAYQASFDELSPLNEGGERNFPGGQTELRAMFERLRTSSNRIKLVLGLGGEGAPKDFGGTFDVNGKKTGISWNRAVTDSFDHLKGQEITPAASKVLEKMPETGAYESNEAKILDVYMHAETVVERSIKTPDKVIGQDIDAAKQVLKDYKGLKPLAEKVRAVERRVIEWAATDEIGLYSKKDVENIMKAHEVHSSLERVQDEAIDPFTGDYTKQAGARLQKFKGGEGNFRSPVLVSAEKISRIIKAGEENQAKLMMLKGIESGEFSHLGRLAAPESTKTRVKIDEIPEPLLRKMGVDPESLPDGHFEVWRNGAPKDLKSNQIAVTEAGKRRVIDLRPEVADAMRGHNGKIFYDSWRPLAENKILRAPFVAAETVARIGKKGITMSPAFAERNYFRDFQDVVINGRTGETLPLARVIEATGAYYDKGKDWQDFLFAGGMSEAFFKFEDFHKSEKLNIDQGVPESTWNMVKTPTHWARIFSKLAEGAKKDLEKYPEFLNATELAPRIATAKLEGAGGETFREKLYGGAAGNDRTVNFLRRGLVLKQVNHFVKFLGPGMAGLERTFRGLSDQEVLYRGFYTLTIPTIANWMANRDSSIYQGLPAYKLANGIPIIVDNWQPAINRQDYDSRFPDLRRVSPDGTHYEVNNATTFYIPKPPGYGTVFSTIPEMMLNSFYGKRRDNIRDFDKAVVDAFLPDMQVSVTAPFDELSSNKNSFTGNPIVSQTTERLMPHLQQMPYTSEVAKQLGKLIGAGPFGSEIGSKGLAVQSPAWVDTVIRDWTGPTGVFVVQQIDKVLHKAGVGNQTPEPYQAWYENPYINGFISRFPNARTQDVEDFYKKVSRNREVVDSINYLEKRGRLAEADEIRRAHPEKLIVPEGEYKTLTGMRNTVNAITFGEAPEFQKMPGLQKRQLIDSLYSQMWQVANYANNQMDQFEEQVKRNKQGRP